MLRFNKPFFSVLMLLTAVFAAGAALAGFEVPIPNRPTHIKQWEIDLQAAASPVKEMMHHFHTELLIIITAITVFVLLLLVYICIRFRRSANPVASKTTHNTLIEIVWTTVPVLILIVIAVPSFRLLYFMDRSPDQTEAKAALAAGDKSVSIYDEMTLKVIAHQWYWEYKYPDNGDFGFESRLLTDDKLTPERPYRLLEVDNRIVLPVNTNIRLQISSADVIHSFGMPSMGLKTDAVPGKLNESWVRITKPGVYYGQCSELCGVDHGYMPIVIEALTKEEFAAWVAEAKGKFADNSELPLNHWQQKTVAGK